MKNFLERLKMYLIKLNSKFKQYGCDKCCLNCEYFNFCKNDLMEFIKNGK